MLWEAADRICGKRLKALLPQLVHVPASRVTELVKQYLQRQLREQPDLILAELGASGAKHARAVQRDAPR